MNKNFIFLALILAVTINDAFSANNNNTQDQTTATAAEAEQQEECIICYHPLTEHTTDKIFTCNHTNFHRLCIATWLRTAPKKRCPICRASYRIVEQAINVNATAHEGNTALTQAAIRSSQETVQELLQAPDIDVNAADEYGSMALHYAARIGRIEIVQTLLQAPSIDVNVVDRRSNTALHWAALHGYVAIIQALLNAGANPTLTTTRGHTPADLADTPEIHQLILEAAARQQ